MYQFKADYSKQQKNYSKWIENTCDYIIVHHTWTPQGTLKGNLDALLGKKGEVSAHFLVDWDGSSYKLAEPKMVCWHAWQSNWWNIVGLNYHWLGIETIWPDFTDAQRFEVKRLIQHLMAVFWIPKENVLRHADLTWAGSQKKQLWDEKSKSRKVDIAHSFFAPWYKTWKEYQDKLVPKEQK